MKIINEPWKLSDFIGRKDRIEAQPVYQRGPVWSEAKQRLLIDSVIRGLDVPKIYLHRLNSNPMFDYQIVDGQQRLTAVWTFADNQLSLALPDELAGAAWSDRSYETLSPRDQAAFNQFELIVAILDDATDYEIRDLFSRLQLGEHLTPPELRNSFRSALGTEVRNVAENHRFFRGCDFASTRFKHHDLAAHAFALELYKGDQDPKAPNLRAMYIEHAESVRSSLSSRVASILNILDDVQQAVPGWLDRKWGFVDLYLALSLTPRSKHPSAEIIGTRYKAFEKRRRAYVSHPERLLHGSKRDRPMYEYIKAFQMGGGLTENLQARHKVLRARLLRS